MMKLESCLEWKSMMKLSRYIVYLLNKILKNILNVYLQNNHLHYKIKHLFYHSHILLSINTPQKNNANILTYFFY